MRDTLYTKCLARMALPSAARSANAAVNGTTVDTSVFGNDFRTVYFVVTTGAITDGTHTFSLEESSDGSSWAAVPADQVQGTLPAVGSSDDNVLFEFGYIVKKQYVRVVATTAGATSGGVFSAVAILAGAASTPVARA